VTLVYVVDDDESMRDSLSILVESAGFEVESFDLARAALDRCGAKLPACIVTDIRMPGMDGLEFQEQLIKRGIDVPMIIMTGHGDVRLAVRAMKAGALDFIEKPFSDGEILASIGAAVEKTRKSRPREVDPILAERLESLTARERDVLELIVAGDPNKVIAYRLDISPRTVEVHRARVMEKMQAKSLPDLVRMALALGIQERP